MKIVVVMKNWLGDLLFQMPALDLIHQKYPGASITCIAPERCREILEAHPAVSDFLSFDEKSTHRSWLARMRFILDLRKRGPWDQGYLFHRSRSRAVFLLLAGVKERIGYGKGRKMFLSQAIEEPVKPLHQLDYFFNMMKSAGFELSAEKEYQFFYKKEDEQAAREVLGAHGIEKNARYICFHLGANWEPKRWPAAHFAALAEKIEEKWRLPVVVTGSQNDRLLFEEFAAKIHRAKIISLIGKTGLRVSAVIYQHAACLVTGDSGPMHIASGVGAPVVALFGPTDPKLTGPRGRGESLVLQYVPPGYTVPFFGKDLPEEGWLSHITPEEVLDAIERILKKA
ncbi:MAG: lipopolysaccharide heptosyltransferase II [Candidatus Omnitrophota bacterium]